MTSHNQFAKELPFDQYSRQSIVSKLIDETARKESKTKKLSIIDLGGHKGKTQQFQKNDDVIILDLYDEKYKGYIKGDATRMIFKDNTFDIACSFDVFEHIPRSKRQAFIDEALRVSKYGIFVAMPIDTKQYVSKAEVLMNEFHKNILNEDHRWLKEHIDYKIPTQKEVEELVEKSNALSTKISSNQIGDWQLMQMLIIAAAKNPEISKSVQDINHWYNQNTLKLDSTVDVGYRMIFFITKNPKHLQVAQDAIVQLQDSTNTQNYISFHEEVFEKFSQTLSQVSKSYNNLVKTNQKNEEKINYLEHQLHEMKLENSLLVSSLSWKITKPLRQTRATVKTILKDKNKK